MEYQGLKFFTTLVALYKHSFLSLSPVCKNFHDEKGQPLTGLQAAQGIVESFLEKYPQHRPSLAGAEGLILVMGKKKQNLPFVFCFCFHMLEVLLPCLFFVSICWTCYYPDPKVGSREMMQSDEKSEQ